MFQVYMSVTQNSLFLIHKIYHSGFTLVSFYVEFCLIKKPCLVIIWFQHQVRRKVCLIEENGITLRWYEEKYIMTKNEFSKSNNKRFLQTHYFHLYQVTMVSFKLSSVIALALVGSALNVNAAAIDKRDGAAIDKRPTYSGERGVDNCQSFYEKFGPNTDLHQHWERMNNASTYNLSTEGLEMKILKPTGKELGAGSLFSSKKLMQYGYIEAKLKSASEGGLVTAFIFMSPNGDEIDWEWVGPEVQTAYYYQGIPDFSTADSKLLKDQSTKYHTYGIDWQPDAITWYLDGEVYRKVTKESTYKDGEYHFPTEASHVELGLWDASGSASTAEWAHGPIDWSKQPDHISAHVEYVKVDCYSS
jgi:beta-glucanase (GH16 family)